MSYMPAAPRLNASRKLSNLERAILVLMLPVAVALWPAAWVWVRLRGLLGHRRAP